MSTCDIHSPSSYLYSSHADIRSLRVNLVLYSPYHDKYTFPFIIVWGVLQYTIIFAGFNGKLRLHVLQYIFFV